MLIILSLALVSVATVLNVIAIIKFVRGVLAKNYEKLCSASTLMGYAAFALFVRVIVNIAFDTDRFLTALSTFLTVLVAYLIWIFFVLPLYERYSIETAEERAKIEHQKIMDELNDQFLNPEKIINKDR